MDNIDYAMEILDISLEFNDLYKFLVGWNGFELFGKNVYGTKEQNYQLVMQAIYKKYETEPKISNLFQETIVDFLKTSKNGFFVLNILNLVKYQMRCEKEGIAPFKVDCDKLLLSISNNIKVNKELYEKQYKEIPLGNFMSEFKYFDDDFSNNYGRRIL